MAIRATVAGANCRTDITRFGTVQLDWLGTFPQLENGIASHDTFRRVFARLDLAGLATCIHQWHAELGGLLGNTIDIDRKAVRS